MTTPALKFVDELPPMGVNQSSWDPIVEELRAHPGQWALAKTYVSPGSARQSVYRLREKYPDCEFVSRGADLYGRLVEP